MSEDKKGLKTIRNFRTCKIAKRREGEIVARYMGLAAANANATAPPSGEKAKVFAAPAWQHEARAPG